MSEKNPLAGFAEGSSKNPTIEEVKVAGTAKTEEEAIEQGKKAFAANPDAAACVIYDRKTGEFKQIAGNPLSPEQFETVKREMLADMNLGGLSQGVIENMAKEMAKETVKELLERAQKGESTDQIIEAMGPKLGLTKADLEKARRIAKGEKSKEQPKELEILETTHKLTKYHTQAQMFVQEANRRYGHADGETRVQYWLEGATLALSWVLGVCPENPLQYFKDKLKVHPEWCCSNPRCGGDCTELRKMYEKEAPNRLPRLGVEK